MKEVLEIIAKSLVDYPEQVDVKEINNEDQTVTLELRVAESDMGKVIGKQGRIAKAIRTVVKAAASRDKIKKLRLKSYNRIVGACICEPFLYFNFRC